MYEIFNLKKADTFDKFKNWSEKKYGRILALILYIDFTASLLNVILLLTETNKKVQIIYFY